MFKNRAEAGDLLAAELATYRDDPAAILVGLPRGGLVVAYQLSLALHLPLHVLITRKIGAPGNPEYAVGAVGETGAVYWNREARLGLSLSEQELASAVRAQEKEVARRVALYREGRPFPRFDRSNGDSRGRWFGDRRNILCRSRNGAPETSTSGDRGRAGRAARDRAGSSEPGRPIDYIECAGTVLRRRKFLPGFRAGRRPRGTAVPPLGRGRVRDQAAGLAGLYPRRPTWGGKDISLMHDPTEGGHRLATTGSDASVATSAAGYGPYRSTSHHIRCLGRTPCVS